MFFLENFAFLANTSTQSRNPEENNDRIIEIQQGTIKNLIHISKSQKNKPQGHPWENWQYLGLMFLEYFFFRLGNLLYLIAFIIILAIGDQETTIMPSILIFFFFPFYLVKRWVIDSKRTHDLLLECYRKTKKIVFRSTNFYKDCTWAELSVGDIILIKRNEVFPADVLILDSENEECRLETRFVDGKTLPTKKLPIKLTKVSKFSPFKGNLEEYQKILTGKFQYDSPSKDLSSFKGTLKLKKDPISEDLTIENLGIKGSILTYTDWVIGLVVYVGIDVKTSNVGSIYSAYKDDFLNVFFNKLNIMSFALMIIMCLICIIRISSNDEPFHQIFKDNSMEILFANFVTLIPTNIQMLIESLAMLFKFMLEKKHKGSLIFYSPFKLPYLSQLTHIILDKGPCLEESGTAIHSLYLAKTKNFFVTSAFLKKEMNNVLNLAEKKARRTIVPIRANESPPPKNEKEPPHIVLSMRESVKLNVPDDGFLSAMPNNLKYKLYPKENVTDEDDISSQSFQGQGETKNQDQKEVATMTLGKVKEARATVEDINKSEIVSPDLKGRLGGNELNDLDKMGSLAEVLGNTNNIPQKLEEIFLALLLCHEVRSKEEVKDNVGNARNVDSKLINEFGLPDSSAILEFIEQFQFKFKHQCRILNNMIKCYTVLINGKHAQFYVLGSDLSHPDDSGHYRFTILVKAVVTLSESNVNGRIIEDVPILYIRTDDMAFLDQIDLDENEKELLKLKMEILKARGLRFTMFCQKKNPSEEEVAEYLNHIRNPKKPFDLSNCELLVVVAIKDKPVKGLKPLVRDFMSIDSKVWLLSNDNDDLVISTASLLGMLSKDCDTIRLEIPSDSCNINEAWIKIRGALNKVKKMLINNESHSSLSHSHTISAKMRSTIIDKTQNAIITHKLKYNVILNGKTLEILAKDQDLLSHFVFISNFCKSLIGYQMTPQHKAFLISLIREQFPRNPVVMSIGDGLDDNLMHQRAHFAVNMRPNDEKKVKNPKSGIFPSILPSNTDISLNSYLILRELVRVKSLIFLNKIFTIVLSCYSSNFLYIMPFAYYLLFFGVFAGQPMASYMLIIKDTLILNALSILYFFWGNKFSTEILKTFVWVYHDGRYMAEQIYRMAFWRVFINSTIDSLIIIVLLTFSLDFSVLGNTLLFEELSALYYSIVYFMIFVKMTFYFKNPSIMLILTLLLAVSLYFIIALMSESNKKPLQWSLLDSLLQFYQQKEALLLLIYMVLYMLIRSFANRDFIYRKFFTGNYGKVMERLENGIRITALKDINFNKLMKRNFGEFNLKNVNEAIRKIFRYKHMDIIIQEMLNPNEINVNESGYHPFTLKFKDSELEAQYMSQITKFSVSKKKKVANLALFLLILIDLGLLLIAYMESHPEQANIAITCTAYTFLLFFCRVMLGIDNFELYYKLPRFMVPTSTWVINIALVVISLDSSFNSIVSIYMIIFTMIFQSEYIEVFIHYFLMCIILFVVYLVKVVTTDPIFILSETIPESFATPQKVSMLLEGLIIVIYEIYYKYKKEQTYRNIFLNEKAIKQENKKIGELLSILVPSFVKESLIQGVQSLSEDQGDVSILFCDICNFDKVLKHVQQGVIHILDDLFRMFDTFCLENDVQKIETVGKTYMACAGLKAVESTLQNIRNKNSTQRVINLALNMMSYTKKFTYGDNGKISIKIGIHYGPVIAGVIGYHKPQFSLIGDTVNTTSRVCLTGEEAVITISKEGFENIKGNFQSLEYTERSVEAKGKGLITTYQIRKKKKGRDVGSTTIIHETAVEEKRKVNFELKQIPLAVSTNNNTQNSQNNQELINMAKNIRKNIKKTTMMKGLLIKPMMGNNSPEHNKDPMLINRLTSANNFRKNSPPALDFLLDGSNFNRGSIAKITVQNTNAGDNKSEGQSFNRMCSDLKCYFDDNNSTFEKKQHSLMKLNSTVSKSEQEHKALNMIQYVENEHYKALSSGNNLVLDKIDRVEAFPGQFNANKNYMGLVKSGSANAGAIVNDDDFFDKLKVKENTLEVLNYHSTWLTIKETDPGVVQEFTEKRREQYFNENWASLSIFSLIYLINTFLMILKKNDLQNFLILMLSRGLVNIANFTSFFIFGKKNAQPLIMRKVLIILAALTASELLSEYFITNYMGLENALEIIVFFVININFSYIYYLDSLFLIIYISIFTLLLTSKTPKLKFGVEIGFLIGCLIMILNNLRVKLLSAFKNFNTLRVNIVKKDQQNNLIVNLLPTHILEKFLRNPNQKLNLTDEFEDVTILFADIAGFTKYSSTVSPTQVVAVLKDLFTEFDKLCLENCVYKLYTIGDCYVVLGVIDAEERDYEREALNVVNMGFQMIEKIKEVKKRVSFHDIDMRIGIHTGKIIGGVIGTDIVRYDVYGKDVVIANKMESNGIEGNITVSERTKEILMKSFIDDFVFAYHKDVHLPSFNQTIQCYKVIDVRNET